MLKNNFSDETRELWIFRYDCDLCKKNNNLELHHILGRVSSSPLNVSLLCRECHSNHGILSQFEMRRKLLRKTFAYLAIDDYPLTKEDKQFLKDNKIYY